MSPAMTPPAAAGSQIIGPGRAPVRCGESSRNCDETSCGEPCSPSSRFSARLGHMLNVRDFFPLHADEVEASPDPLATATMLELSFLAERLPAWRGRPRGLQSAPRGRRLTNVICRGHFRRRCRPEPFQHPNTPINESPRNLWTANIVGTDHLAVKEICLRPPSASLEFSVEA